VRGGGHPDRLRRHQRTFRHVQRVVRRAPGATPGTPCHRRDQVDGAGGIHRLAVPEVRHRSRGVRAGIPPGRAGPCTTTSTRPGSWWAGRVAGAPPRSPR
jgi:hypothetical protein